MQFSALKLLQYLEFPEVLFEYHTAVELKTSVNPVYS